MLTYNSDSDEVKDAIDKYNKKFQEANDTPNFLTMFEVDKCLIDVLTLAMTHDLKWYQHNSWRILNTIDLVQDLHENNEIPSYSKFKDAFKLAQAESFLGERMARLKAEWVSLLLTLTSCGLKIPMAYYAFVAGKNFFYPSASTATISSRLQASATPALKSFGFYCFDIVVSSAKEVIEEQSQIRNTIINLNLIK